MWTITATNILVVGLLAQAATIVALILVATLERKPIFAPINAISHIFFEHAAIGAENFSPKFTLNGVLLNLGAAIGWAAVAEGAFHLLRIAPRDPMLSLLVSIGVTILAYITDFHIVPKRFTPGFEQVITHRSLILVYVVLALSFFAGTMLRS